MALRGSANMFNTYVAEMSVQRDAVKKYRYVYIAQTGKNHNITSPMGKNTIYIYIYNHTLNSAGWLGTCMIC